MTKYFEKQGFELRYWCLNIEHIKVQGVEYRTIFGGVQSE